MNSDASGQFVTPQNSATIPIAAHSEGEMWNTCPNTHPNVAPTKKDGTISPPLKPPPSVTAVKSIFNRKAYQSASPPTARPIVSAPMPKKASVRKSSPISSRSTDATSMRR